MKTAVVMCVVLLGSSPVMAQGRGRGAAAGATKPIRTTAVRVVVKDKDGASLDNVRVMLSGDTTGDSTTAGAGMVILSNLKDGSYRIRCEREGFVTLEREFTLQNGAPSVLELTLKPAPPPPAPPPPVAPPAPVVPSSGSPVSLSVVEYLDHNFIGKEPLKESVLACTPLETVRLLQLRDPVAAHSHADVDEILYVVAGEGAAHLGDQIVPMKAGTMIVVPHGDSHGIERKGKNPLIVLSTLAGVPCQAAPAGSK